MATIIMKGWTPWDECKDRSIKRYMQNHGNYAVWLKGSREYIYRNVYEDVEDNCWVWFYGKWIEVKRRSEYVTVLDY